MNRRPPVFVISKAVVGFLQDKQAKGLSPRTVDSYSSGLKLWLEFQENIEELNMNTGKMTVKHGVTGGA